MKGMLHNIVPVRPHRLALLLALYGGLLTGCGPRYNETVKSVPLPAANVTARVIYAAPLTRNQEIVATVLARSRATLEARISGRIKSLPVEVGQRLKAGDLIAQLDAPEVNARLEQAQASLQQAERDWKRISALVQEQAVTRSEADAVEGRFLVAKGTLAEAQAMLAYIEVHAPFDGVVTRKYVEAGDLASPGKPLIDLEDASSLQVIAEVPDSLAQSIRSGEEMTVLIADKTVRAPVAEVAPSSDPVSRTLRIKLNLPASATAIPGQFARLVIPLGETRSLRVPASAILRRGQLEIAFVVDDKAARLHLVRTGRPWGDEVEILSGLEDGDTIVTSDTALLVDGQPVNVR